MCFNMMPLRNLDLAQPQHKVIDVKINFAHWRNNQTTIGMRVLKMLVKGSQLDVFSP